MTSDDGYWFFGLANLNGDPPRILDSPDPAITYPPVAINSLLMARFKEGPLGDLDYVSHPSFCFVAVLCLEIWVSMIPLYLMVFGNRPFFSYAAC